MGPWKATHQQVTQLSRNPLVVAIRQQSAGIAPQAEISRGMPTGRQSVTDLFAPIGQTR